MKRFLLFLLVLPVFAEAQYATNKYAAYVRGKRISAAVLENGLVTLTFDRQGRMAGVRTRFEENGFSYMSLDTLGRMTESFDVFEVQLPGNKMVNDTFNYSYGITYGPGDIVTGYHRFLRQSQYGEPPVWREELMRNDTVYVFEPAKDKKLSAVIVFAVDTVKDKFIYRCWWYSPLGPDMILETLYVWDFEADWCLSRARELNPPGIARLGEAPPDSTQCATLSDRAHVHYHKRLSPSHPFNGFPFGPFSMTMLRRTSQPDDYKLKRQFREWATSFSYYN